MRGRENRSGPTEGTNLEFIFPLVGGPHARKRGRPRPSPRHMKVVGLFAGIGGIELGLSRAGHESILLNEIDPSAGAVLRFRFPGVPLHEDVTTLSRLPEGTDLVTAGFPCQDLSQAGKTAGIDGKKSGLVGEVFRLLDDRDVPWVLLENVPFMLQLAGGRALDVIINSLEARGYRWAYRVVNSLSFGVPQRRERVFLLASRESDPRDILLADDSVEPLVEREAVGRVACGFYWTEGIRGLGWAVDSVPTLKGGSTIGIPSPPAILMPNGFVGKPDIRDAERLQGFPVDWTKPAEGISRASSRWKLVGNAVTVNVAEWLGRRLRTPGIYDSGMDSVLRKGQPWPRAAWCLGEDRHSSTVTSWPTQRARKPLEDFLRFPAEPLSQRATSGFLARTRTASLRFPHGFIRAVEAHLEQLNDSDRIAV